MRWWFFCLCRFSSFVGGVHGINGWYSIWPILTMVYWLYTKRSLLQRRVEDEEILITINEIGPLWVPLFLWIIFFRLLGKSCFSSFMQHLLAWCLHFSYLQGETGSYNEKMNLNTQFWLPDSWFKCLIIKTIQLLVKCHK